MCKAIIIKLIVDTTSLWTMTGVPVNVCVYDIGGIEYKERQIGVSCSVQPSKIPDKVLKLAMFNACATPEKK